MCRHQNVETRYHQTLPETEMCGTKADHPSRTEIYHNPSKTIHKCDRCGLIFPYDHSLKRHLRRDHLHKDTIFESMDLEGVEYFGTVKKVAKEPVPIVGAVEEVIVPHKKLRIVSINVFSLVSVKRKLRVRIGILKSKADIIAISETKFHQHTAEYKVPGYYQAASITRKAGAGGLLIMAKNTIKLHSIQIKNVLPEVQTIEFEFNKHKFIAVYRSPTIPKGTPEKVYHKSLIDFLEGRIKKFNAKNHPYVLMGDFNLGELAACHFDPDIKMTDYDNDDPDRLPSVETMWADFFMGNNLEQWVFEPTFPRYGSILDIVMTPNDQVVQNLTVEKELFNGKFDHYAVSFDINTSYETNETPRTRRLKTKKNWEKFRDLLIEARILENCPTGTADEMTEYIIAKIQEAYDEAIPLVVVKPRAQCYLHRETKAFIKRQTRLRSKLRSLTPGSRSHIEVKARLIMIDTCVDDKMKNDRVHHQIRLLEISKEKNKNLFAHVKEAKSTPSVNITGPVKDMDGVLRTSDKDVADAFSSLMGTQLKSDEKSKIDWTKPHPDRPKNTKSHMICCIFVGKEAIIAQIKKSRIQAAPGPDGIPMEAFSVAKDILAEPLTHLFNLINQTGSVPKHFKEARVKMLFKKNEKSDMVNYRPLAMANHIAKLWERIVNSELMGHLEKNNLLSKYQYGFRPNRGTAENLLQLWEHVVDRVEKEKTHIELWSLDLTKAFDKLNHVKVLELLHKSGVYGFMGLSIQNWLIDRNQFVEVGSSRSTRTAVNRSCIQGSVLGPTLWLMYINTLLEELDKAEVKFYAYADDVAIVQRLDTEQDKEEFEKVLGILQKWAEKYEMAWSPLKTQRLVFKYQGGPKHHDPLEMFFGGKKIIPLEKSCVSLGVKIGANCTFMEHIKSIKNKIKTLTGLVKKNFANLTQALLDRYYTVYVMPSIIYCCQIWHGGDEVMLRSIEKAIEDFWKLSPSGSPKDFIGPRVLLIIFDLNYAKKMWDRSSMIKFEEMYKLDEDENDRPNEENRLRTRAHSLKCSRLRFSIRTRNYWNLLPNGIRELRYDFFKREAKKFVVDNKERFLNFGNKDKTGPKDLPKLIPYVPPKTPANFDPKAKKPPETTDVQGKKKAKKKAYR